MRIEGAPAAPPPDLGGGAVAPAAGTSSSGEACPVCGNDRTGLFCEVCGYDFGTGTPAAPVDPAKLFGTGQPSEPAGLPDPGPGPLGPVGVEPITSPQQ